MQLSPIFSLSVIDSPFPFNSHLASFRTPLLFFSIRSGTRTLIRDSARVYSWIQLCLRCSLFTSSQKHWIAYENWHAYVILVQTCRSSLADEQAFPDYAGFYKFDRTKTLSSFQSALKRTRDMTVHLKHPVINTVSL